MKLSHYILILLFVSITLNIRQCDKQSYIQRTNIANLELQESIDKITEELSKSNKEQEDKYKQIKNDNYVKISNEPIDSMLFWYNNF